MNHTLFTRVLFLSLLFICVIARPDSSPKYVNAAQKAATSGPLYAKYDTVAIRVLARDNVTHQIWTTTFYPRVDEFTVLELAGTWTNGSVNGGNNTIGDAADLDLSVNQMEGAPRTYAQAFNPNLTVWLDFLPKHPLPGIVPKRVFSIDLHADYSARVVPYFSALVLLHKGNITQLAWDDGCHECNARDCLDNVCTAQRWHDNKDRCTSTNCNIQIYLAWMGRDKNDAACRSVSSLPSSFSKYSIQPMQNFGNGLFGDFIYGFTTNAPNPVDNTA